MSDVAVETGRSGLRNRLSAIAPEESWPRSTLVEIRVTVLTGIWLGALVGGVCGRLAMLVLRLTSPDTVHGAISDDGFFIGQVTFKGTYDLIGLGAAIGIIGAAVYRLVDHWLIGPGWFRQLTSALGAGAVVGTMLVHTDGVDFRLLRPLWLAIAFFVLIPALFGFFVGPLEQAIARPGVWVNRGRQAWILTVLSLVVFLPIIVIVAFVGVATLVWAAIKQTRSYETIRGNLVFGLVVRAAWLGIAVLGLVSLISDARTILTRVT